MPPSNERRRFPRGQELAVHFLLGGLRWVYAYAALLVALVALVPTWQWLDAETGTPEHAAAVERLATLFQGAALPLAVVVVAVSVHVGRAAGAMARYVADLDQPFEALRTDLARAERNAQNVIASANAAARAADDPAVPRREVAARVHAVLDAAERQLERPRASLLDPGAGERIPVPEAHVATALRRP